MTAQLPEHPEVEYGYIAGRFGLSIADGTDADDTPDLVPATAMTVKLTPAVPVRRFNTNPPTTIIADPINAVVGTDGLVRVKPLPGETEPREPGVKLVTGTYQVTYSNVTGTAPPPHSILVTTEHTKEAPLDLTPAGPLVPSPAVKFVVNEQVYADTIAARDEVQSLIASGLFSPAPDHQTVLIESDVTLPIDRTVLTLRASAPAVLTVPDAPEGSVITVHVAEGWEHISWAAGVVVTGDSLTTETWVVLVRKEGALSLIHI